MSSDTTVTASFNTQPPEGGWYYPCHVGGLIVKFQHTAARRRLAERELRFAAEQIVSTHSRPKAAGPYSNTPNL